MDNYHKVYMWGQRKDWPTKETVVFPKKWTEEDQDMYFNILSKRGMKSVKKAIPSNIVLSQEDRDKILQAIITGLRESAKWNR